MLLASRSFGQNADWESLLSKNIIYYNLCRTYKSSECFDANDYGIHQSVLDCGWQNLIPDLGFKLKIVKVSADLHYPDTSVTLIAFYKPNYEFYDSINDLTKDGGPNYIRKQFDSYYLIACKQNKLYKFISGNIFKDKIWNDFAKGGLKRENLIAFIKIKCFNFEIENIRYSFKQGKKYVFSAECRGFARPFTVIFDSTKPERIVLKSGKFSIKT